MKSYSNTLETTTGKPDKTKNSAYNLIRVPVVHIADIWNLSMALIIQGMAINPRLTVQELADGLVDQSIQMWLVVPAGGQADIVAVFFTQMIRDRGEWVLTLFGLGGRDANKWVLACHEAMQDFACEHDCGRVVMCGRKAWQRILPGYRVIGEQDGHLIYERKVIN